MFIIGISAYYHDSAACLLKDGKIVAGIYADADGDGIVLTYDSKGQITSQSP